MLRNLVLGAYVLALEHLSRLAFRAPIQRHLDRYFPHEHHS